MNTKHPSHETHSGIRLLTEHGKDFEIPEGGSLGLLALGYVGLMLWREKKREIQNQIEKPADNEKA